MSAVSVLEVASPAVWDELRAVVPLDEHLGVALSPTRQVVLPSFEHEVLPKLGSAVLIRYARRDAAEIQAARADLRERIRALDRRTRAVLVAAQRHALDGTVLGIHAWDVENDARHVRALHGAGLVEIVPDQEPYRGRYRLHPDLPDPEPVPYDFEEAVMEETDDLGPPRPGVLGLLHDVASLAAALQEVRVRRTLSGRLAKADTRKLFGWMGLSQLGGALEDSERWGRALRALEALGAVSMDPLERVLHVDPGLERVLEGDSSEAIDRLVHRLVDRDLHVVVPAVREAIRQAGPGAIDLVVFSDLLREQHREVLFPRWHCEGTDCYPMLAGEAIRPFDDEGWETIEDSLVRRVVGRLELLGLVRRAPGVFAGTEDGRHWARFQLYPTPPVWVSSDLEAVVPPGALTPYERLQIECLARCQSRDVVDRYRLDRMGLFRWLAHHEVDDAFALLEAWCPALPLTVREALGAWGVSATRIVLTRGVILDA